MYLLSFGGVYIEEKGTIAVLWFICSVGYTCLFEYT